MKDYSDLREYDDEDDEEEAKDNKHSPHKAKKRIVSNPHGDLRDSVLDINTEESDQPIEPIT